MNTIQVIVTIAAVLSLPVSVWAIVYFSGRLITQYRVRSELGDMPSAEEISAHYQANNAIIEYRDVSPTEQVKAMK